MKNKINLAELLKDCPRGMELDCTIYEGVVFHDIVDRHYPIRVRRKQGGLINLNAYGCMDDKIDSKCVIYPKGKTSWEGFMPPCNFKNGDIVYTNGDSIAILSNRIGFRSEAFNSCCGLYNYEFDTDVVVLPKRFATEEEKQILFSAIKANGYRWDEKTKTLEKLTKFKDGDIVACDSVGGAQVFIFKEYINIENDYAHCYMMLDNDGAVDFEHGFYYVERFATEEETKKLLDTINARGLQWNEETKTLENWTIQDAKDGDVIFCDSGWACIFKNIHGIWYSSYCFITDDGEFHTGYERHAVDSTINGKAHLATKEQSNLLFQKIKEAGYKWNPKTKTLENLNEPKLKVGDRIRHKNSGLCCTLGEYSEGISAYRTNIGLVIPDRDIEQWELAPNKFEINTLKPFDKVLVRDCNTDKWNIDFFAYYREDRGDYQCMTFTKNQCIPYESNKYLMGTTNDCDEFFKTW